MISLSQYLSGELDSIMESYIYSLDREHQFGDPDIQSTLKHITKQKYIDTVQGLMTAEQWEKYAQLVHDATDIWFNDFGKDPACIPFTFDENGNFKIRRAVGEKLGYEGGRSKGGVTCGNRSLKLGKYISTKDQETATVLLWNRIVKHDEEAFDLDNIDGIKEAISMMSGGAIDLDSAWAKSCALQINAIKKYIEKNGWDYREYVASRYGDDMGTNTCGSEYAEFVKIYIDACCASEEHKVGTSKDTYDPSDIILVRRGKVEHDENGNSGTSKVAELLSGLGGMDYTKIHSKYRDEFFKKGEIIGISLKKIDANPKYDLFNVEQGTAKVNVRAVEKDGVDGFSRGKNGKITGAKFKCPGNYKFSETSDPEGDGTDPIKENIMYVTLRSFSAGKDLDIDIHAQTGPALGKVPRDLWRTLFNVNSKYSEENIKLIAEKMEGEDTMTKIIEGGIKNGPWCLPFVLVH